MPVVYLCPTGTYVSVLAANLHLGKIDVNCNTREIQQLKYFLDKKINYGSFLFVGEDQKGEKIYTLGTKKEAELIYKSAESLINNEGLTNIKIINVSRFSFKGLLLLRLLFNHSIFKFLAASLLKRTIKKLYNDIEGLNSVRQEL